MLLLLFLTCCCSCVCSLRCCCSLCCLFVLSLVCFFNDLVCSVCFSFIVYGFPIGFVLFFFVFQRCCFNLFVSCGVIVPLLFYLCFVICSFYFSFFYDSICFCYSDVCYCDLFCVCVPLLLSCLLCYVCSVCVCDLFFLFWYYRTIAMSKDTISMK